jgi:hypothetical protein
MTEYLKFIKDPAIIITILIILSMEILMQFGCYKPFIKRNSFAANVNRITDHALEKQQELDPNILIVGTSMAYEGLSADILNKRLSPFGYRAQSIAIPGAELIVQALAVEKVLEKFKNVEYIIHVNEAEMPWVDFKTLSTGTLAMVSEFNRSSVFKKTNDYQYDVSFSDLIFISIKLVTYRRDIGDWILNPALRIKYMGRSIKEKEEFGISSYSNQYNPSLSQYSFSNLEECMNVSHPYAPIAEGSDTMHRDSIYSTCYVANEKKLESGRNESTERYKLRLTQLYRIFNERNIKVINVFPPLPKFLNYVNYPERIAFWKSEYSSLMGDHIIDLYRAFPEEDSPNYFYDLVHLNQKGNEIFSNKLADELIEKIKREELK